jgi:hypothetical protein
MFEVGDRVEVQILELSGHEDKRLEGGGGERRWSVVSVRKMGTRARLSI